MAKPYAFDMFKMTHREKLERARAARHAGRARTWNGTPALSDEQLERLHLQVHMIALRRLHPIVTHGGVAEFRRLLEERYGKGS